MYLQPHDVKFTESCNRMISENHIGKMVISVVLESWRIIRAMALWPIQWDIHWSVQYGKAAMSWWLYTMTVYGHCAQVVINCPLYMSPWQLLWYVKPVRKPFYIPMYIMFPSCAIIMWIYAHHNTDFVLFCKKKMAIQQVTKNVIKPLY